MDVACSCGKTLHVPQRLLGKLVRCPGCGATIRAVASEVVEDKGSPAPQSEPSSRGEKLAPHPAPADKLAPQRAFPWLGLGVGVGCVGLLAVKTALPESPANNWLCPTVKAVYWFVVNC